MNIQKLLPIVLLAFSFSCKQQKSENGTAVSRADKPNIIFIMADDLGYGDLGSYGQKVIQTPFLDLMAREGTRFTNCYSGSPVCAPARSTLMTGQHTGHTTVRGNSALVNVGENNPQRRVPLFDQDITIAEVLKKAGYATAMFGKWGLGEPGTTGIPNKQGFDEWYGYLNQRNAHHYYPPFLWHNQEKDILEGNQDGAETQYSHDLFAAKALEFIKDNKDKPFFMYLPYTIPHDDYEIPSTEPYSDKSWTEDEKTHAAMIFKMDADIRKMFNLLKDLKLDENTIVFFCSDNGAAQRWDGRFDSSAHLKGRKRAMYEGGIRVPMIVRWPGKIPANTVSEQAWYFPDVLPTLADIANTDIPKNIDGVSMKPQLLNPELVDNDRVLYWEFYEKGFHQAIRWKNWKGVRFGTSKPLELYDLSKDEGELNNIAENHPEIVQKLTDLLVSERTESDFWPVAVAEEKKVKKK